MVVILHNIRSLHNVGSIFRTADGAGVEKIYLCGVTPAPIDPFGRPRAALAKVSLGAEKFVLWEKVFSAAALIKKLKNPPTGGKYKIFAVEQAKNSISYYRIRCQASNIKKVALVFGSEVRGLPKSILKLCDKILEIPMYGRKESLNVSVAAGIAIYEFTAKAISNRKRKCQKKRR